MSSGLGKAQLKRKSSKLILSSLSSTIQTSIKQNKLKSDLLTLVMHMQLWAMNKSALYMIRLALIKTSRLRVAMALILLKVMPDSKGFRISSKSDQGKTCLIISIWVDNREEVRSQQKVVILL